MNQDMIRKYWPIGAGAVALVVVAFLVLGGGGDDDDGPLGSLPSSSSSGAGTSQQSLGGVGQSSGDSGGAPNLVATAGAAGNLAGLDQQCVAMVQAFSGLAQLAAGLTTDSNSVQSQLAAASGGQLPNEIEAAIETIENALTSGNYAELSRSNDVQDALNLLTSYADKECTP